MSSVQISHVVNEGHEPSLSQCPNFEEEKIDASTSSSSSVEHQTGFSGGPDDGQTAVGNATRDPQMSIQDSQVSQQDDPRLDQTPLNTTTTSSDPDISSSPSSAAAPKLMADDSTFECNICLDTARNAVISLCGHLFCWSCLHQWLETRPNKQVCPVCKSAIGRDKVIPLYGRNGDQKDPRDTAPPRPQGQRSEPTNTVFSSFNMAGVGGENGFQFSFGIGAFPFALFATAFNFGDRRPPPPAQWTYQYEVERTLHHTFICVALLFMIWLLMA